MGKLLLALLTICSQPVWSQAVDIDSISLQDLLDLPTAVTTRTALSVRSSPGSVTVITGTEIKNSGARDLIDVLLQIPGISFGNDSYGAASVGMRGMWANEGKVLFLFDGLEMNEILFSTIQFGNRYPVDQIERVEVIRGPGSAIYGGFAELAVINVISKDGATLNGCELSGKYGQMNHIYGRRNITAACGKKVNGVNFSVANFSGQGQRSDRMFTGYDGAGATQTYRFEDNRLDPNFLNVGISSDKMRFRYIREIYQMTTSSAFGYLASDRPIYSEFHGHYLGLEYDFRANDKLKITPIVQYKIQKPWQTVDQELTGIVVSNFTANRLRTAVHANYGMSSDINLLFGVERLHDSAVNENYGSPYQQVFLKTGGSRTDYFTDSVLAQGLFDLGFATMTVGARYDKHETVDGAWSPRLAFTKSTADWHAKFVAAAAFRAPTIMNLDSDPNLKPDRSNTVELEGGYKTSNVTYLTLNLFRTEIKDPIIYGIDPGGATHNFNGDRTSTVGGELEFKIKDTWGYATSTYSYYQASGSNSRAYKVADDDQLLLGFPAHKLTLNASFANLIPWVSVNPSAVWMSEYYGYDWDSAAGARFMEKYTPGPMFNLFFEHKNLWTEGLNIGLGVFNISDVDWRMVQPYEAGIHAAMPTPSREVVARIDYELNF